MFKDFLDNYIINKNKENLKEFKKYLSSSACNKKITTLKEKNKDLDLSNIKENALNGNPYAIALLRKDTTKQNVSEKAFFDYVGIEKAPQTGKDSIRFNGSKAADFIIGDWYGTQKYIKEAGGAQDNQINDAIYFAKQGNKLNKKVIVCIDGDYGVRKIHSLLEENDNLLIYTADKLKEEIDNGRFKENPTLHNKL